jgi:hypothetical protein
LRPVICPVPCHFTGLNISDIVKEAKIECFEVNRNNYSDIIDHTFKFKGLEKVKIRIEIGRVNFTKSDKISGSPTLINLFCHR